LEQPGTLGGALSALAQPGARAIAGGTDLLPSMKHRILEPPLLVSLRGIHELRTVTPLADGLRIGSGVTLRELARHPATAAYPALRDACRSVATPTIQAMATIGGNVLLDTRCIYYNQPLGWRRAIGGCLKCEGSVCHVAPRGTGCYAAHSADTVPVLWLLGAVAVIHGPEGPRSPPLRDLFPPDGRTPPLSAGEILVAIDLPAPVPISFRKLRTRAAIDYPLLLVAAARCAGVYRAVISAIGPQPIEVTAASETGLVDAAHDAAQPLGTHAPPAPWRKRMIRVELRRALDDLAQGAGPR
jgi:4-hydroxybenzoyl-CoA reductase subunit beta